MYRAAQWICWPLAAASLWWLNRDDQFDIFALYYFGSYFGGMVVAWTLAGRAATRPYPAHGGHRGRRRLAESDR